MLNYVVTQTLASKSIDEVIISTTSSSEDIPIVDFCKKNSIKIRKENLYNQMLLLS